MEARYNFELPDGCTHYKQVGEYIRCFFAHYGNYLIFYYGRLGKYRIFRAYYFVAPYHKTGWGIVLAVHGNEVVKVDTLNNEELRYDALYLTRRKESARWPLPYDYKKLQELLPYFKNGEMAPGYIPLKHY